MESCSPKKQNAGSSAAHKEAAKSIAVTCAVLTVSDTRTPETDKGGAIIKEQLAAAGHVVKHYAIVKDEPWQIDAQLRLWLTDKEVQAIISTGGTGIAKRDTTIEVVERLLSRKLDGFGELFRMLSWEQVGSSAMLSRATGGLADETLIFALPGSTAAVELGMTKLIAPELSHLVWERRR